MDERLLRSVAWAIAEASWRKTHRRAADAGTPEEYANTFWQNYSPEAKAAVAAFEASVRSVQPSRRVASDRFN